MRKLPAPSSHANGGLVGLLYHLPKRERVVYFVTREIPFTVHEMQGNISRSEHGDSHNSAKRILNNPQGCMPYKITMALRESRRAKRNVEVIHYRSDMAFGTATFLARC